MAHYQFLDELVKEYIIFRGFTSTIRAFDADLKSEKEKGFRVDKILEQINQLVVSHDLAGLTELWKHFETKIFSRLENTRVSAVRKLENSILKLYAVNCIQSKQPDKLREFFEKLTPDLQGQSEWKDWFALPFLKDPQENPSFTIYFSRQWQDTLMLSLHNFLALVFQGLPPPRLADYKKSSTRFRAMREEIKVLKLRLATAGLDGDPYLAQGNLRHLEPPQTKEIMDDFYLIAQETAVVDSQVKSIKSFLRTITGSGNSNNADKKRSPVLGSSQTGHKSRSSSKTRTMMAPPTSLNVTGSQSLMISKQPLKRVTQSVNPLEVAKSKVPEPPSTSSDLSPSPTPTPALVSVPPTPSSSRYILLGQEEYSEHRSSVVLVSVSSVGGRLVSADQSGVVKVWSPTPSPATLATFISGSPVSAICWVEGSDRYFLYGTTTGQVRLCDVSEKMSIAEVPTDILSGQSVSVLQCGPSGSSFLVCSGIKILMMDTKTCNLDRDLSQPSLNPITSAQFNHNGSVLVHGGSDGKLGLTDMNRGELLSTWSGHSSAITCIRLNRDETAVWSLGEDGSLAHSSIIRAGQKVWEGQLGADAGGERPGFCLSPDGEHILTGTQGGAVIYRLPRGEEDNEEGQLEKVLGLRGEHPTSAVDWSAGDCGPAVTAGTDGAVKIYTLLCQ